MSDPALASLLQRRFIAVIGKGGTGKTTVSGLLALLAMQKGKRVLVAMSQARERLSSMLETEFIETDVKNIWGTIDAVNMEPDACLDEYGMMVLKSKALYRVVMDNKVVKGFLHAVPGLDAWSMLGKALFHTKEKSEDGSFRYDLVILDAPATGHGIQMLRVPQVICDVSPPGLLREEAEDGLRRLRDPQQTAIVVASLPEEMPTAETEELVARLRNELHIHPQMLVVNQVQPHLFENRHELAAKAANALQAVDAFAPFARTIRTRVIQEQVQTRMLQRYAALKLPRVYLPALPVARGIKRPHMQQLAKSLSDGGVG